MSCCSASSASPTSGRTGPGGGAQGRRLRPYRAARPALALRGAAADEQGGQRGALRRRRALGGPATPGPRAGPARQGGRPGRHLPGPGQPGRGPGPRRRASRTRSPPWPTRSPARTGWCSAASWPSRRSARRPMPRSPGSPSRRLGPRRAPGRDHDLGGHERRSGTGNRIRRDTPACRYGVARRQKRLRQVMSDA